MMPQIQTPVVLEDLGLDLIDGTQQVALRSHQQPIIDLDAKRLEIIDADAGLLSGAGQEFVEPRLHAGRNLVGNLIELSPPRSH